MIRTFHHQARDLGRGLDGFERPHRAATAGETIHNTRVQFDLSLLIGQPAVSDARVGRIFLDNVDACDHSVQRLPSGLEDFHRFGRSLHAVSAGNNNGERGRSGRFRSACVSLVHQQGHARRGCNLDEIATLNFGVHKSLSRLGCPAS